MTKYLANFSDEFDGKQYEPGDEVKGLDDGTLDYLVKNGRLTKLDDEDPEVTAVGNSGKDAVTNEEAGAKTKGAASKK